MAENRKSYEHEQPARQPDQQEKLPEPKPHRPEKVKPETPREDNREPKRD